MTDMERAWAYGRIIRQIWDEGQKTRKLLSRYKHHKIMLVPAEMDPEELADIKGGGNRSDGKRKDAP